MKRRVPSEFTQQLLRGHALQKELDFAAAQGAKAFAEKLNKAREEDAEEFLAQARISISGLSDADAKRTLCVLACRKLFAVGYREFADLFRQVLQKGEG